jgi:transcription-repair coupling factor (superfamily II helicase)
VFPDWETLTYDEPSPHQDIVSERINLLTHMPTTGVLPSVQAWDASGRPAVGWIGQHLTSVGDRFDINHSTWPPISAGAGYRAVENVLSGRICRYAVASLISLADGSAISAV